MIPEVASDFVQLTATELVYQPLKSGDRPGLTEIDGSVASYFSANGAFATLPALSVQLPGADAFALSGPE